MTGLLYSLAAALLVAALGGIGWIITKLIDAKVAVGTAKFEAEAAKETTKRVMQDVQVVKEVRADVDMLPDAAVLDELRAWTEKHRPSK